MPHPDPWQNFLSNAANHRAAASLQRQLRPTTSPNSGRAERFGRSLVSFASNDYLGLARHPELCGAARQALAELGLGASASRLITGTSPNHVLLEEELARFTGYESALTFSTGYQTNVGTISALADDHTTIFSDQLNHASIIDGCRLSRAEVQVFPNRDYRKLEQMLRQSSGAKRRMIISESLFSIDGVAADLQKLSLLAREYEALLIIDDAHGFGVLGQLGGGSVELQGAGPDGIDVLIGTFSKALGSLGGFVCTSEVLRSHLVNTSRALIFTTAASHADVAGALAALRLLPEESLQQARQHLVALSSMMRREFATLPFEVSGQYHIVSLITEGEELTLRLAARLDAAGLLVPAIRPPTVPKGRCALRFSLTAAHTAEEVRAAAAALRDEVGLA